MKQNAADIIVMSAPYFILKTKISTLGEDGNTYKFTDPYRVPVQQINDTFKARMITDLASAEDGIYTWILKDDIMYLSKTLSYQEIGSLHVNLSMFSETKKLTAAGELKKENTTVSYNLRSGTYMDKVIKTREARDKIVRIVSDFISTKGLTPKFLKCKNDVNTNGTEEGCTEEYEVLAGMNIIDKQTSIVTPMSEIELYKTMFTLEGASEATSGTSAAGGSTATSSKGGKRKSRSKLKAKSKAKKHRSQRKRPRLT
jgi:hypothetical protein